MSQLWVEDLEREFEGASLGDQRRSTRLVRIAEAIAKNPSAGFPKALASEAELEAFYRFINNDAVDADAILEPHLLATRHRAAQAGEVVVVHDTTHVEFPGVETREGLGYTTALGRQGFQAHVSLRLSASAGVPLGIAHLETCRLL